MISFALSFTNINSRIFLPSAVFVFMLVKMLAMFKRRENTYTTLIADFADSAIDRVARLSYQINLQCIIERSSYQINAASRGVLIISTPHRAV